LTQAIEYFESAIAACGGPFPEAWYQLGLAQARTQDVGAAATSFRTAIEQRGGIYPEAHQDLGRILYGKGDLEAANAEYSLAVRQRGNVTDEDRAGFDRAIERIRRDLDQAEELQIGLRQAPPLLEAGVRPAKEAASEARTPAKEAGRGVSGIDSGSD
jgi:tetratricopeptide (TPR) repeat protein